jgi:undecaprenyl-diphosphatase
MKTATLLIAILVVALLGYASVTYDYQIFLAIKSLQNPVLDVVMLLVTNIATLYIGVPIILAIVYLKGNKKLFADLVIALVAGIALTLLLKMVIARPRPEDIVNISFWASATFSSFPSDHASTAFAMFGVIGHHLRKHKVWMYLLAALIAFSRVYLGVHFPTDVVAGAFIGIVVSQTVIKFELGNRLRKALRRHSFYR